MPGLILTTSRQAKESRGGNSTGTDMAAGVSQLQHSVCSGGAAIPGCMTWDHREDHVSSTKFHDQAVGSTSFPPAGLSLFLKAARVVHAVFPYRPL